MFLFSREKKTRMNYDIINILTMLAIIVLKFESIKGSSANCTNCKTAFVNSFQREAKFDENHKNEIAFKGRTVDWIPWVPSTKKSFSKKNTHTIPTLATESSRQRAKVKVRTESFVSWTKSSGMTSVNTNHAWSSKRNEIHYEIMKKYSLNGVLFHITGVSILGTGLLVAVVILIVRLKRKSINRVTFSEVEFGDP
ncbi:uncharacterized protein LOC130612193 isoform X2 [Hydractinia symbiolongicarpus]|uniref:uncharacterized protein LOC130612193 isoform X2 n=1 Tax=Hydractinia symbiolongicarpus TaxID=13093 RepID=UPI00254C234B|nr:uncharacterized protein LOC130612193 isoform X2 [Hydractinia symbiolongicarpus]